LLNYWSSFLARTVCIGQGDQNYSIFERLESSDTRLQMTSKLDALAEQLRADPQYDAHLLSYAGKISCAREATNRVKGLKQYLVAKGASPDRIIVVDGGFRNRWRVDLWLNLRGTAGPKPSPTMSVRNVHIVRGRRNCPAIEMARMDTYR
jgi:hypothetical protein